MSVCCAKQMDGRPGTKKGKAVKQLPAMKDMKDKLLTNQREAVRLIFHVMLLVHIASLKASVLTPAAV